MARAPSIEARRQNIVSRCLGTCQHPPEILDACYPVPERCPQPALARSGIVDYADPMRHLAPFGLNDQTPFVCEFLPVPRSSKTASARQTRSACTSAPIASGANSRLRAQIAGGSPRAVRAPHRSKRPSSPRSSLCTGPLSNWFIVPSTNARLQDETTHRRRIKRGALECLRVA